ncbi:hypothetical protein B296_00029200, partial [Ensete ventricosum]
AAALGRHLAGGQCRLTWALHLLATALVGDSTSHRAAPCGLVASSRHLRPGREWLPLATWPWVLPMPACASHARERPLLLAAGPERGF